MIVLAGFAPFQPTPGLALWSLIIFCLFWWIMSKYAFKPIASALKKRETDIQSALDEAKKSREEMANMQADNEKLIAEAREERSKIIREAKETSNKMVSEAKEKAKAESNKIISDARLEIEKQRTLALSSAKNQVGSMALGIAEKVIRKELKDNKEHQSFVNKLVEEINLS